MAHEREASFLRRSRAATGQLVGAIAAVSALAGEYPDVSGALDFPAFFAAGGDGVVSETQFGAALPQLDAALTWFDGGDVARDLHLLKE